MDMENHIALNDRIQELKAENAKLLLQISAKDEEIRHLKEWEKVLTPLLRDTDAQLKESERLLRELTDAAYDLTVDPMNVKKFLDLKAVVQKAVTEGPDRKQTEKRIDDLTEHCGKHDVDFAKGERCGHCWLESRAASGPKCDTCGTVLIDKCGQCGAPICCPKCCDEATAELKKACPDWCNNPRHTH